MLNLVLILVIFRIDHLMNDSNRYFLGYLSLHFIFQLVTTLNISFFYIFGYGLPIVLVCIGRLLAFVFFLLFIISLYKNKRASLNFIYLIPFLILVFANHLNSSGIKFTDFTTNSLASENILGFNTGDFEGKEDLFVVTCLNAFVFTFLIFFNYFKILISNEISDKLKKNVSDFVTQYYLLITIAMLSTLTLVGLFLVGFHSPLSISLVKIFSTITLLVLVIKPSLLKGLSNIKNIEAIDESLNEVFAKIQSLLSGSNGYLNPNYVISNISVETGFRDGIVRDSIKKNTSMSVPLYINSFRVEYACKLIKQGYLESFSMEAIAEKSGFNSQENFNRVFKQLKSCTPSEFLNNYKRNDT